MQNRIQFAFGSGEAECVCEKSVWFLCARNQFVLSCFFGKKLGSAATGIPDYRKLSRNIVDYRKLSQIIARNVLLSFRRCVWRQKCYELWREIKFNLR